MRKRFVVRINPELWERREWSRLSALPGDKALLGRFDLLRVQPTSLSQEVERLRHLLSARCNSSGVGKVMRVWRLFRRNKDGGGYAGWTPLHPPGP
jgi:hypothetical protein